MSAHDHLQPRLFDAGQGLDAPDLDSQEYARQGRELAQFGEVAVSMPPQAAQKVAKSGSIRTQHETGTSEGALDPSTRREVEGKMGYGAGPVYGYMDRGQGETPPYGTVDFRLKSSVKDRSNMYAGDSLNAHYNWQDPVSHRISEVRSGAADPSEDFGPYAAYSGYADTEYVEAHILPDERPETRGKVTDGVPSTRVPVSDVRRVDIHERGLTFDPGAESRDRQRPHNFDLGRQLSKAGLEVEHVLTDQTEQPVLPMDYHGPPPSSQFGERRRRVRHQDMAGRDRWGSD